jgi:hypothetical protein
LTAGPNHEKLASLKQNHTTKEITMQTLTKPTKAALTQWKVSVIRYGNGDPAGVKNLMNAPYVCKHILCAMQHLFNRSR